MPEEQQVNAKNPSESTDEQQGIKGSSNDLAVSRTDRKRKRQESSGGHACKKNKVS